MSPLQIADSKKPVRQAYGFAIVGDKVVVTKGTSFISTFLVL